MGRCGRPGLAVHLAEETQYREGQDGQAEAQNNRSGGAGHEALAEPGVRRLHPASKSDAEHQIERHGFHHPLGNSQVGPGKAGQEAQGEKEDGGLQKIAGREGENVHVLPQIKKWRSALAFWVHIEN